MSAAAHGLRLPDPARPGSPAAVLDEVALLDRAGVVGRIPLATGEEGSDGRRTAVGEAFGWRAELVVRPAPDLQGLFESHLRVAWSGDEVVSRGLRMAIRLGGDGDPDWLIPGCFYGENRSERCTRRYPRYDRLGGDASAMVSSSWAFRADRAAVPFVLGRTAARSVALVLPDGDPPGGAGFGFAAGGPSRGSSPAAAEPAVPVREGPTPGDPRIWIDLPAREEPVRYDGGGEAGPPVAGLLDWQPGSVHELRFGVYVGGPERGGYAPLLRVMEARGGAGWEPAPWVGAKAAAELAAEGLLRWHHRPGERILVETATFDRDLAGRPIVGDDRPNMHVGWLSGTPCAGPLLAWGRGTGDTAAVEAATGVLDHIAEGVSPSGLFWGEWRADRGWSGGWNPTSGWIHTRTAGEATLFLGRALSAEALLGKAHPTWEAAYDANLAAITTIGSGSTDGRFGTYVDAATGSVMETDGTGGLIWIPALLEGAERAAAAGRDGDAWTWRAGARRAGEAYAADVEGERLFGAPEDVHLAPSSEDGYGALMAYAALAWHETDPAARDRWLALALRAAEWTMTFRLTHDVAWPEHTILSTYGFRARGTDIASPANQHLHAYGLVCVPEQLRLAAMLRDDWLRRRAWDHVLAWRQLLARADGDLNGRRGMVTERVYHTDCFGPKGALLPLSHAWCLGLILGAALHELDDPDGLVRPR